MISRPIFHFYARLRAALRYSKGPSRSVPHPSELLSSELSPACILGLGRNEGDAPRLQPHPKRAPQPPLLSRIKTRLAGTQPFLAACRIGMTKPYPTSPRASLAFPGKPPAPWRFESRPLDSLWTSASLSRRRTLISSRSTLFSRSNTRSPRSSPPTVALVRHLVPISLPLPVRRSYRTRADHIWNSEDSGAFPAAETNMEEGGAVSVMTGPGTPFALLRRPRQLSSILRGYNGRRLEQV